MCPKYLPVFAALVVLTCGVAAPGSAEAVSVTNRDARDHKLTIMEGDAKVEHQLKPNATLDGICLKSCLMRLNDSEADEYELEGTEIVSIEDGYLYYDGADAAEPSTTAPKAPAPPPR